ncbi:flagellar biosynthesis protein FlhB [Clostridioides difficile]
MSSDKTEQPTAKKKKDERKKGNIAKSREVSNAFTLIAAVLCIYIMTNGIIKNLKIFISSSLKMDFSSNLTDGISHGLFTNGLFTFLKIFLPIGLIILSFGVISNVIQSGFLFSKEGLKPKFSKLNPMQGFKNMFSQKSFVTFFKNTILLILLSYIGYTFVKKNYLDILKIGDIYFPYLIYSIFDIVKKLFNIAIIIAVSIGAADFAYQLYSHKKGMKMTKQEVKEEYKQAEGDPQVKSQIKQKQRQLSSQRMIQNAKDATVIVTNPTHISIAIRYERDVDSAPIVIAKGADVLAMKIREIAKEKDIPIIENKPLARMIYKEVDVEQEVPAEMYQAVAEVLVAVYKIKNRYKRNK